MELFQNPTDDQIALMACLGALLLSGGLMALTGWVRAAAHRPPRDASSAAAIRLPQTRKAAAQQPGSASRKAA